MKFFFPSSLVRGRGVLKLRWVRGVRDGQEGFLV